jgi:hypothetical protein
LAKTVDLLNRGLKAKCLANPAWASRSEHALNDFTTRITAIQNLAEVARRVAEEDDAKQSETRGKIFAVLTPLRAFLPKLETNQKILAALELSPGREFCLILVKLIGSSATLMGRILLFAKDQGRDGVDLEKSLAVGRDTLNVAKSIVDKTHGELPNFETIQELSSLVIGTVERFAPEVNPGAPEGKELHEQAALILQGGDSLQATVKRALEQPAQAAKLKSDARPEVPLATSPTLSPPPGFTAPTLGPPGLTPPVVLGTKPGLTPPSGLGRLPPGVVSRPAPGIVSSPSGLTPPPGSAAPRVTSPAGETTAPATLAQKEETARRATSRPALLINSKESQERRMTRLGLKY